jgi:hypothetical protein
MISGTNTDTPVCNGGYHAPLREEATTRVLLLPAACLATDFRRQRSTVHPPLIIFASERALIHPPAHLAIRKGPHHCCRGYAATIEPECASKLPFSRHCSASSCCASGWPRALRYRFLFPETVWAAARSRRWGGRRPRFHVRAAIQEEDANVAFCHS